MRAQVSSAFGRPRDGTVKRVTRRLVARISPIVHLAIVALVLTACRREYGKQESFASPDGKHFLDVTEEIQGANDANVWWQHISIRRADRPVPIVPANVLAVSARKVARVAWDSPAEVVVEFNRSDGGSDFEMPAREKSVDGVVVKFLVWKK